jgi:hypothetical protein
MRSKERVKHNNILSKTTFPSVNEVSALGDERHRSLLETFKDAIETRIAGANTSRR